MSELIFSFLDKTDEIRGLIACHAPTIFFRLITVAWLLFLTADCVFYFGNSLVLKDISVFGDLVHLCKFGIVSVLNAVAIALTLSLSLAGASLISICLAATNLISFHRSIIVCGGCTGFIGSAFWYQLLPIKFGLPESIVHSALIVIASVCIAHIVTVYRLGEMLSEQLARPQSMQWGLQTQFMLFCWISISLALLNLIPFKLENETLVLVIALYIGLQTLLCFLHEWACKKVTLYRRFCRYPSR